MGEIEGQWLSEEQKLEILVMIEQAKEKGLSVTRSCIFWGLTVAVWSDGARKRKMAKA